MKSSDFKRHGTTLRTLQEESKSKKINWDRLIYIAILSLIAILILKFFITKIFIVKADGHVKFNKLDVMFSQHIQVTKFYVKPGDEICQGDTLFQFAIEDEINDGGLHRGYGGNVSNDINLLKEDTKWAEREKLLTLKKIESNEIDKKFKKELIGQISSQVEALKKEIYLNIQTSEKLTPLYTKQSTLEAEIKLITNENKFLYTYLEWLKSQTPSKLEVNIENKPPGGFPTTGIGIEDQMYPKYYISPIDGTITQIFLEEFEVALASQQVLSIHIPQNVYVRAYFSQNDLGNIKEEDVVKVLFPDGTQAQGIIKHIYFATYQIPDEFQKKYEPVTRTVAADIYPLTETDLKKWKKVYKLGVKVTKPKYW